MVDEKKEMTVQEARRVLKMRTASVYSLLRDEILQGRKNATGEWTIDADSVEQYRLRRLARRNPVRARGRVIDVSPHGGDSSRERRSAMTPAKEEGFHLPARLRLPEIHRAPGAFDELPDELPDPSVGWVENPERRRGRRGAKEERR